ncbi:hypothetical protein BS329_34015 [Amycolatopsis coloradensis]|uniref:DUF6603 domain-containing protein n=1 Tax=Amycolatopsis coloradensis TaxID=76021 RepID=A0A1R0KI55_9PSEU|nr:DUF6603 domain-containing protein [Amycolatopsis coloradensis]OLZ45441.1 hypothetical protein BS329_34015 [Amycolatopsis coloradensis]
MALSLKDLRDKLTAAQGSKKFDLALSTLGSSEAISGFVKNLGGGSLGIEDVVRADTKHLVVIGKAELSGLGTRPVLVRFAAPKDVVTGILLDVTLENSSQLPATVRPVTEVLAKLGECAAHLLLVAEPVDGAAEDSRIGLGAALTLRKKPEDTGELPTVYLWGFRPRDAGAPWSLGGEFAPAAITWDRLQYALAEKVRFGPPSGISPEPSVKLTGLSVVVRPPAAIPSVRFRGDLSAASWEPVSGFTISDLYVECGVAAPFTASGLTCLVCGTLTLGGKSMTVTIEYPGLSFGGVLTTPIALNDVAARVGTFEGLPSVRIDELEVHGDIAAKSLGFDCALASDWEILPGLKLTEVRLRLAKAGSAVSGGVEASWQVGGGTVLLTGQYADKKWKFLGQAASLTVPDILAVFGITKVPEIGKRATTSLYVDFDHPFTAATVTAVSTLSLGAAKSTLELALTVTKQQRDHGWKLGGLLHLAVPNRTGPMEFKIDAESGDGGKSVVASWSDSAGVGLKDLTDAFGVELHADFPVDLLPKLTGVSLCYSPDGGIAFSATADKGRLTGVVLRDKSCVVTVAADLDAKLSQLPILKGHIPAAADAGLAGAGVLAAPKQLSKEDTERANTLLKQLPGGAQLQLPDGVVPAGIQLGLLVTLGGRKQPVTVPVRRRQKRMVRYDGEDRGAAAGLGGTLTVERSFGPLHVRTIRVDLVKDRLTVGLDAAFTIAGITVDMDGLGVSTSLKNPADIAFALRGLGVDVRAGAVEVGGAMLHRTGTTSGFEDEYDGVLVLVLPNMAGRLAGQLAYTKGGPWAFSVFGEITAKAGGGFGPPPFRVTGAMLGGGYNAAVRVPEPHEVERFPLVAGLDNPDLFGENPTPGQIIKVLFGNGGDQAWLATKVGQNWVAAGLRFTSFEFLSGKALALVEFGNDLTVGLFALLNASFPTKATGTGVYAQIEIAMRALYQRSPGLLSFTAQLTSNSYLLHPSFKLTGGLAVCVWVPPEPGKAVDRSGDFVISLGGYHPLYSKPSHYPDVPRLGAHWAVSNTVTIKAEAFLAITPGSLQLGSGTSVVFDTGTIRAWFIAGFSGYLEWTNPPRYDFRIGVRIGFRARIDIWPIHTTIEAEVGADCHIWGDPFGGRASVKYGPVSFSVPFGSSGPDKQLKTDWPLFQKQLPPPAQTQPVSGLLPSPAAPTVRQGDGKGPAPWLVSSDGFSFVTGGVAPITLLVVGSKKNKVTPEVAKGCIRPMRCKDLTCTHQVSVTLDGVEVDLCDENRTWRLSAVKGSVPAALWGDPDSSSESLLTGRIVGLRAQAPLPTEGESPGTMTEAALALEAVDLDPGDPGKKAYVPLADRAQTGQKLCRSETSVGLVAQISTKATARTAVLGALTTAGTAPKTTNDALTALAGSAFTAAPMIPAT